MAWGRSCKTLSGLVALLPITQVHAYHRLCSEDLPYDEGKHLSSGEGDPVGSSRQEGAVLG